MDKKTKQLLIVFGSLAALLLIPTVIYFLSLLSASTLSTTPFITSLVLGGIVVLAAIASAIIFKNKLTILAIVLAVITAAAPVLFINDRFGDHHKYHAGYIRIPDGYYRPIYGEDEYGNQEYIDSVRQYKCYDKFGMYAGTDEEICDKFDNHIEYYPY